MCGVVLSRRTCCRMFFLEHTDSKKFNAIDRLPTRQRDSLSSHFLNQTKEPPERYADYASIPKILSPPVTPLLVEGGGFEPPKA